eukprot:scaffold61529_cov20-Prasinocladus_malaysianus.AAC.1
MMAAGSGGKHPAGVGRGVGIELRLQLEAWNLEGGQTGMARIGQASHADDVGPGLESPLQGQKDIGFIEKCTVRALP